MEILKKITEDEMISIFLQAEMDSVRFGKNLHKQLKINRLNPEIIEKPNTTDSEQNKQRRLLLREYRGFGQNKELFENFPKDFAWSMVVLNKEDLQLVKYINYDYWVELSGGSRLVADGARNVLKGVKIFNQPNTNFIKAAEALSRGIRFPEPILVSKDENSDLVILEGHLRLTAYLMEPEFIPEKLKAVVGFSKDIVKWDLY